GDGHGRVRAWWPVAASPHRARPHAPTQRQLRQPPGSRGHPALLEADRQLRAQAWRHAATYRWDAVARGGGTHRARVETVPRLAARGLEEGMSMTFSQDELFDALLKAVRSEERRGGEEREEATVGG